MHKENSQAKHTADNGRGYVPFIDWGDLKDWWTDRKLHFDEGEIHW